MVLAAMTMLAPSCAARRPIALPMPRLAPVMNRVFPFSEAASRSSAGGEGWGEEAFLVTGFVRCVLEPLPPRGNCCCRIAPIHQQLSQNLYKGQRLVQEQMMMRLWNADQRRPIADQF